MICPLCLEKAAKVTREHLPFRALYKGLSSEKNDAAAIVKICENYNQEKSVWDQEFLALYGDRLDIGRAQKAQISLKNFETLPNAFSLALVASRLTSTTGEAIMYYNGVPCDIISQWMWRCGRGIYRYFEEKPFRGNRVMVNTKTNRMFSIYGIFFESEEQFNASKPTQPTSTDPKPMRVAKPREIFDVTTSKNGGFSYKGVIKIRNNNSGA